LEKVLQPRQYFIFDYGFLPRTLGEDGDPPDVIILSSNKLISNLIVEVVPISLMKMIDEGEGDDKIIAIVKDDFYWSKNVVNKRILENKHKEIEEWFKVYKGINGTLLEINGFRSKKEALEIIGSSREEYNRKFNRN